MVPATYLVKPVRIEELKNIWQHEVRKRFDLKDQNNHGDTESGDNYVTNEQQDQSRRYTRKRKDQTEEGAYDSEEKGQENDDRDSSAHKKQRVVWSQMLHEKFVDAVNLLGFDKAVTKKILELMDVENLKKENVASHLQKYRQYLKKVNSSIIQPDNT